jgi:hypothetical protein
MKNAFVRNLAILSFIFGASSYASTDLEDIEFSKEMTAASLDFHALLDADLDSSAFLESTKVIIEKPEDKDLARLVVIVNRAPKDTATDAQLAKVYQDGVLVNTFTVSTGKSGHLTRTGYFRPVYTNHLRVYEDYYSSTYNGSQMKKAVFFSGGYAIHHTDSVRYLGQRASHGCVRFHIDDISWINDRILELGGTDIKMKKWAHNDSFKKKKKYNIYYRGLAQKVSTINRYSGVINTQKEAYSLDAVILIKDQRDTEK